MRICHVTPHLPPDQAANALLPFHLGQWAVSAGDEVAYLAHPPRQDAGRRVARVEMPGPVAWVPRHRGASALMSRLKIDAVSGFITIAKVAGPLIDSSDLVHLHSNGFLVEVCAWLAARRRKPTVLTLYGTEVWHYKPRRLLDLFTRAYRSAAQVTFYSQGLMAHASDVGLGRRDATVIYPPVAEEFLGDSMSIREARDALGLHNRHVIVNVKRLHPLAGQRYLLQAMGEVVRWFPDTRLVICGTGPLRDELQMVARSAGVERHVTFAGLVDNAAVARYDMAADVFVLPSLLEACPTVALEALACGTPVVSSDNPGGVELNDLFGVDVAIVPRENDVALAGAIIDVLEMKRRVRSDTRRALRRNFSPDAVAAQFLAVYRDALRGTGTSTGQVVPA
jgi:glycosyltransferase involved in cell wall biosynthesis